MIITVVLRVLGVIIVWVFVAIWLSQRDNPTW